MVDCVSEIVAALGAVTVGVDGAVPTLSKDTVDEAEIVPPFKIPVRLIEPLIPIDLLPVYPTQTE